MPSDRFQAERSFPDLRNSARSLCFEASADGEIYQMKGSTMLIRWRWSKTLGVFVLGSAMMLAHADTKAPKTSVKLMLVMPKDYIQNEAELKIPASAFRIFERTTDPKSRGDRSNSVTAKTWLNMLPAQRLTYLEKLYSASTVKLSSQDQDSAYAACYEGSPVELVKNFFGTSKEMKEGKMPKEDKNNLTPLGAEQKKPLDFSNVVQMVFAPSADGLKLGIGFTEYGDTRAKLQPFQFRLPNCRLGLGMDTWDDQHPPELTPAAPEFSEEEKREPKELEKATLAATLAEIKQRHADRGFIQYPLNLASIPGADKLPTFELKADYENAKFVEAQGRPWKDKSIKTAAEALNLALLVQAHVYQGLATPAADKGAAGNEWLFDPRRFDDSANGGKSRYWCQMPWQNIGPKGRESFHGLTQEFPLGKGPGDPTKEVGTKEYEATSVDNLYYGKAAVSKTYNNYGTALYNGKACETLGEVFGPSTARLPEPEFTKAVFREGSLVVKYLFTEFNGDQTKDALTWHAHVSSGSQHRTLQELKHMQMDIAIRDSTIKGARHANSDWVFFTYYYDKDYNTPATGAVAMIPKLPPALKHMRPMGVQVGFDKGIRVDRNTVDTSKADSIIFEGAVTNVWGGHPAAKEPAEHTNRLNGPADNPASSCLGCHAVAGTSTASIPGPRSQAEYDLILQRSGDQGKVAGTLDFSMQLRLARENWDSDVLPYLILELSKSPQKGRK